MTVITKTIKVDFKGENDMVDITDQTLKAILESKLKNGIVIIFVSGSTAAVTTIEYEPDLRRDFPTMLNRIIPKDLEYKYDEIWRDGNGHSHVRASLIGDDMIKKLHHIMTYSLHSGVALKLDHYEDSSS